MIGSPARTMMAIAGRCLGDHRAAWAEAMDAELEEAEGEGRALPFAAGCLLAAWRGLPTFEEGRFALASYLLAIGCLVPVATILFAGVLGPAEASLAHVGLLARGGPVALLNEANMGAMPSLVSLVLILAAAQLRLAWLVLDRDWARAARGAAAGGAATATLIVFTFAAFLDPTAALLQGALLLGQLAAIASLARWHAQLGVAVA